MSSSVETLVSKEYKYGFVTDIESDVAPKGLSEDIVRAISAKKGKDEIVEVGRSALLITGHSVIRRTSNSLIYFRSDLLLRFPS